MRVTGVFRPADYRGDPAEIASMFATLMPGVADPAFDERHAGMAIVAQNPVLALELAKASRAIALDLPWCARADLRELAIQTANLRIGSAYSFDSRRHIAAAAGLSEAQLAALADWRASDLFDEEQRLVIEYAEAVVAGDVPDALFAQIVARYGEKGAVECTTVVGFFAFWAMLLNAVHP